MTRLAGPMSGAVLWSARVVRHTGGIASVFFLLRAKNKKEKQNKNKKTKTTKNKNKQKKERSGRKKGRSKKEK
jgi:hypothetical protein